MHILISPNTFKNSIDAGAAALAIKEGLQQSKLKCECECFPVGDGGDGTGDLIISKLAGTLISAEVNDPLGRKIKASFGLIDKGSAAVIEMANASGLKLLKPGELNPLLATSYGTGEQVRLALDNGAKKIIIGMGGSATVDGGYGILKALGARFLNARGKDIDKLPGNFKDLHSIELAGLDPRIAESEIIVLCDVDNKLLGAHGAAKIFGPQKGASSQAVQQLEGGLAKFSIVAFHQTGRDMAEIKYGGTAGGAAAGLYALLNAKLVNGIDYFLGLTDFEKSLENNDLVITGEGSIDEQTLQGKAPFGVALHAKQMGLPVIGLAGRLPLEIHETLHQYFDVLMPISHEPLDIATAIQCTSSNLKRTAFELGNLLGVRK
ncbi:glycerate kinase [Terrimonas pollutisoli]|uniref:glycerate kinase n=1 Tax=Terrimonas pollutisoli TaxID=3034147 RepID=UPI0023ECB946|nr:glycerate kinase [Terrimonas sp. H1YJ31]